MNSLFQMLVYIGRLRNEWNKELNPQPTNKYILQQHPPSNNSSPIKIKIAFDGARITTSD